MELMPNNLTIENLALLTLIISSLLALIGFLLQQRTKFPSTQEEKKLTPEEAEEKSYTTLHRAIKKAQNIIGKAELESVKIAASSKFETRKLEKKYETEMETIRESLEKSFDSQVGKTQGDFIKFLDDLKVSSEQSQNLTQEIIKQRVNDMLEQFETNLSSFLTQTEQKSTSAIELELRSAKELLDTYKRQQLSLIDENIVSMLEKTLSLVLTKKLTLRDHVDLVYDALEKAKAEKFIA